FDQLLDKFSLIKVLRIGAWIQRFLDNCRTKPKERKSHPIDALEIERVKLWWIKRAQLQAQQDVRFEADQLHLNFQPNNRGILECRGRIVGEYPIYLPDHHPFTTSLVHHAHISTLHGGVGMTMAKNFQYHYHEKSATELYQTLANITQLPKEDHQTFLIRALTVRQKILFASNESGSNITYDESSVQGLFLHALETGLVDETIRAKMIPTLKNPSVADEDLIEAMSMPMSAETERLNKFGASGRAKQESVSSLEMEKK
ncbi:Hypothetical predicted protein, partial [Paramuricea clavata]